MKRCRVNLLHLVAYIFMVFVELFCSCQGSSVTYYDGFRHEFVLKADSVSTQKVIDNVYLELVDGKMVVSSFKTDTLMHFYTIPGLKYEFSSGVKGHSFNELESYPSFAHSMSGELYVRGYTINTLRKFKIGEGKLIDKGMYKLSAINTPNDMYVFHDSLLYYNDMVDMGVKSYNMKTEKDDKQWMLSSIYGNVTNKEILTGVLCSNDSLSLYAMQYKHEFIVLKTPDLSHLETISWSYDNQDKLIGDKTATPKLYYTYAISTKHNFYLLCRNAAPYEKNARFSIEVYDNNLVPVCRYILNRKIYNFVVDEKNGYIYGFGINEDCIYRFKLNK